MKSVHEYYLDYLAVDDFLFTLNLKTNLNDKFFRDRVCDGIISSLLSLKKRPFIRFDKNSEICKNIAEEVSSRIDIESEGGLFDFKKEQSPPILLILDRRDDPITPLLQQWTYQAMIHELIGIENNIVKDKQKELVMSAKQDEFFNNNMYMNYGDLCTNIKNLVDKYSKSHSKTSSISSLEDIRNFMTKFPEFQKEQTQVEKHVTLVYKLKDIISERKILNISKIEQELVCGTEEMLKDLKQLLKNQELDYEDDDLVRMVLLYALRYEKNTKEIQNLIQMLDDREVPKEKISLIKSILKYAGSSQRNPGLFEESTSTIQNIFTMFGGGLKDAENVFTQHKPLLKKIMNNLGKLDESIYPFYSLTSKTAPKEVIIFIVGGITYEEAYNVQLFNNDKKNTIKVILGGNIIHNSQSFLKQVDEFSKGY